MQKLNKQQTLIKLDNVSYSYGREIVVKNISVSIHKGDYVGIVGPNGGGKTTLIKLMLGIIKPVKGRISLFGKEINHFTDWYRVGYVPQRNTVEMNIPVTVEEMVSMGRYGIRGLFRFPNNEDRKKTIQALKQVDMIEFKNRQMSEISGGQQQRVFIARALASEPEIIFLDEPTVGVDVKTQKQFYSLLRKLNRELKLTLILVSHELDIVAHESTELGYINCTMEYFGEPMEFIKGAYFHDLIGLGGLHA